MRTRRTFLWRRRHAGAFPALLLVASLLPLESGRSDVSTESVAAGYERSDVMIPMRDGIRLHAQIWRPKNYTGPLPMLFQRTPYGFEDSDEMLDGKWRQLAEEKFIFVLQDLRGRYKSEGEFRMLRALQRGPNGTDESTDTHDTIEWLAKNVPGNNGKVGIWGVSYGGYTTMMGLVNPHPALKAASEQASPADQFLGDDFHHNGAFRLSYGFEYSAAMEANGRTVEPPKFATDDLFPWYLAQVPLHNMDTRALGSSRPTWQHFVDHPNYDEYWRSRAMINQVPSNPGVPNLNVAGWWDQEDFYGPLTIYAQHEKGPNAASNFLVVGPWNHGGWSDGGTLGRTLGPLDFGSDTALHFRREIEAPWFAYWLKDKGPLNQPKVLVFQTGTNVWRRFQSWPPVADVERRYIFLGEHGQLSFTPPTSAEASQARAFVSDPNDPVPYRPRPIPPGRDDEGWGEWLTKDQRFVEGRPDVLTWVSPVLTADLAVSGAIKANLVAATSGTDADWIVKLIDVYPETPETPAQLRGYRLMIANEVMRGRFWKAFSQPQPLPAGEPVHYSIGLNSASHVFLKGHRIMAQVQSTWFPLIDRNPQKYVPNIFYANRSDYQKATHRVFASSNIELPVEVAGEPATPQAPSLHSLKSELDSKAAEDKFSGAVLLAKDGEVKVSAAYGEADRAQGIANTLDTRFRLGSMNKMFTAVAVLQLVEAGKIKLDDPLGMYIAEYPNRDLAKTVTIHQLLTHAGGTGDFFGPLYESHRLKLRKLDDYVALLGSRGLEFEPGSKREYSNYGFILLGLVIERVSGMSYYDYVQQHIFKVAGMPSTDSLPEAQHVDRRAIGYMRVDDGKWVPNNNTLPLRGTSAGGGYSTVSDLLHFAEALLQHKLLSAELTELLITAKRDISPGTYAYGFQDQRGTDGLGWIGHGGGAEGMNGDLRIFPRSGYVIAVLANLDPPAARRIAEFLNAKLLN